MSDAGPTARAMKRGLKILVISEHYPPGHIGGYGIACQRTVDLLCQRGHQVQVLTTAGGGEPPSRQDGVSRKLHWLPPEGQPTFQCKYVAKQLLRAWRLRCNRDIALAVACRFRPDVVFIWQSEGLGIGMATALERAGYRVVHRKDDCAMADLLDRLHTDSNPVWRAARRALYGVKPGDLQFPHVLVVSRFLKQRYLRAGLPPDNVAVIYNGVPESSIVPDGKRRAEAGGRIRLLVAGRVCPSKGVEVAVRAMAALRSSSPLEFTLEVVGPVDPTYRAALSQLIASLGVRHAVALRGPCDPEKMIYLYDSCDALLFPSLVPEGFGLVLVEAMARGLPVIAVNRGGPAEIVTHQKNGLLVEPDNPEALAAAIAQLFADPSLLRQVRSNAPKTVRQRFTLERSVDLIEEYLLELCRREYANLHVIPLAAASPGKPPVFASKASIVR